MTQKRKNFESHGLGMRVWNSGRAAYGAAKTIQAAWKGYKQRKTQKKKTGIANRRIAKYTNKKKKKFNMNTAAQFGSNKSFAVLKYKPTKASRLSKMLTEPATYEIINPFQIFSANVLHQTNRQTIKTLGGNFGGRAYGGSNDEILTTYNAAISSLALSGLPFAAGYRSVKYGIDSYNGYWEFTNQMQANTEVDIYDLVSKVTKPAYTDPAADWTSGLVDQGQTANAGNAFNYQPRASPTTSKQFNITWKIIKRTRLVLSPGQLHQHSFSFQPKRYLDMEYVQTYEQIKGITCATMFVLRGAPSDDTIGLATGTVYMTPQKISGWVKHTYKSHVLGLLARNNNYINNLSDAVLTTTDVINEESGAVVNVLTATNIA